MKRYDMIAHRLLDFSSTPLDDVKESNAGNAMSFLLAGEGTSAGFQ